MAHQNLGEFEHQVLLAILRLESESYSVPIVEELEVRTGRDVSQAAVFIVLRRLENKGLLSSRIDDTGGRTRRYFRLQPAGLERLREARRGLVSLWDGVTATLDDVS